MVTTSSRLPSTSRTSTSKIIAIITPDTSTYTSTGRATSEQARPTTSIRSSTTSRLTTSLYTTPPVTTHPPSTTSEFVFTDGTSIIGQFSLPGGTQAPDPASSTGNLLGAPQFGRDGQALNAAPMPEAAGDLTTSAQNALTESGAAELEEQVTKTSTSTAFVTATRSGPPQVPTTVHISDDRPTSELEENAYSSVFGGSGRSGDGVGPGSQLEHGGEGSRESDKPSLDLDLAGEWNALSGQDDGTGDNPNKNVTLAGINALPASKEPSETCLRETEGRNKRSRSGVARTHSARKNRHIPPQHTPDQVARWSPSFIKRRSSSRSRSRRRSERP